MVFRAELILMDFIKMTEIQTIGRKVVTCPKLHTHSVWVVLIDITFHILKLSFKRRSKRKSRPNFTFNRKPIKKIGIDGLDKDTNQMPQYTWI